MGMSSEPNLHLLCVRAVNQFSREVATLHSKSHDHHQKLLKNTFSLPISAKVTWPFKGMVSSWPRPTHPVGCVFSSVPTPTWPSFILREFFLRTDSPSWTSKFFFGRWIFWKKNIKAPTHPKKAEKKSGGGHVYVSWSFESGQIRGHLPRFP